MALLQSVKGLQEQLQDYLGPEKYERYLENIQDWFGQRVTKDFYEFQMSLLLDENSFIVHNEMMRMLIYCCDSTDSAIYPYHDESMGVTKNIATASCSLQNGKYVVNANQFINASSMSQGGEFDNTESGYITVNFVDSDETNGSTNYYNRRHIKQEVEEDVKPTSPSPVDWMYNVEDVRPDIEDCNSIPSAPTDKRFPDNFADELIYGDSSNIRVFPNVTHGLNITDRLSKNPQLKKHFGNPVTVKDKSVYLPVGSTLHGQFLVKAWEHGVDSVDVNATSVAIEGVKDHVCSVVKALIMQRRAFRMRDNKVPHSIGLPYPNPYLCQGQQLYDNPYSSDTAQLADAMQVPSLLSLNEEKERLAALQIAASVAAKSECRFPASRVTTADLLDLLETNPTVIPQTSSRLKLQEIAQQNYKGYGGNFHSDDYNDDERSILPLCSY